MTGDQSNKRIASLSATGPRPYPNLALLAAKKKSTFEGYGPIAHAVDPGPLVFFRCKCVLACDLYVLVRIPSTTLTGVSLIPVVIIPSYPMSRSDESDVQGSGPVVTLDQLERAARAYYLGASFAEMSSAIPGTR